MERARKKSVSKDSNAFQTFCSALIGLLFIIGQNYRRSLPVGQRVDARLHRLLHPERLKNRRSLMIRMYSKNPSKKYQCEWFKHRIKFPLLCFA